MEDRSDNIQNEKARRQSGRREGEFRKQRKLSVLEARRGEFVIRARRALLMKLLENGEATGDDARHAISLPADIDPKLFGSVPGSLALAGIIKADGFVKTSRPKAHARPIRRWVLVDRAKAEQWLIDNPRGLPPATEETSDDTAQALGGRDLHQQTLFGAEGE